MENLPQELVDRISSFLDRSDLKNTLLLSQSFQYAAEQYSEAFQNFTLTTGNVDEFFSTYSGRRFSYLRNVVFETYFPALVKKDNDDEGSDDDLGLNDANEGEDDEEESEGENDGSDNLYRDTAEDLNSLDKDFTRQINFLFSTLKTVETRLRNSQRAGTIHLTIFTPTQ